MFGALSIFNFASASVLAFVALRKPYLLTDYAADTLEPVIYKCVFENYSIYLKILTTQRKDNILELLKFTHKKKLVK